VYRLARFAGTSRGQPTRRSRISKEPDTRVASHCTVVKLRIRGRHPDRLCSFE